MNSEPQAAKREYLNGLVERITYHNAESGFCVLRVKVRGSRDLVTVTGEAASVSPGEWIESSGEWLNHQVHGLQFKASFLRISPPTSAEGIEKYLASGMILGIGPVYAGKLVKAFGEEVFDVIERKPQRLRDVDGIGPVRADRIIQAWQEQREIRDIMMFLHRYGVSTARALRIFKTYGVDAVERMTTDPYCLARDIRGIGFKTADVVAQKLNIDPRAMIRVRAGIAFALSEGTNQGHCGLPRDELVPAVRKLLELEDDGLIERAIVEELEDRDKRQVVADTLDNRDCLFLRHLHRAEAGIAERLTALLDGRPPWPEIDAEVALSWVEKKTGLKLADSQQEAVRQALRSKVFVITGGPGVGKTTVVNSILRILAAKRVVIELCAPTGRAARRMSETTGRSARTIHRLLEVDARRSGFKRNEDNPFECDLLVVDELSMVDVSLMNSLLRALPRQAALLVVGDVDQLPSVGPGQVLGDLLASRVVPVVRLTEVFRQAARSRIVTNAHSINQGKIPDLNRPEGESDFYFWPAEDPELARAKIVEIVTRRMPDRFGLDPIQDIQVLCPMNRGGVGAHSLNRELQAALNPPGEKKIERFGWVFAVNDKVMQIENDYDKEVYNGDIGRIVDLDAEEGELSVTFAETTVPYRFGELDALVPAYAITIHKSQGSEYPAVLIPVTTQHYLMLQRNLLYTGVTRGKRMVVLVGQRKAVAIAVRNASGRRRYSKLRERLTSVTTNRQPGALPF